MILFGDLACPDERMAKGIINFVEKEKIFEKEIVVGNLEGNVYQTEPGNAKKELWNHISILDLFADAKKTVLGFANNHSYDFPEKIGETVRCLKQRNIIPSGVMYAEEGKAEYTPEIVTIDGKKYVFISHCWSVMSKISREKKKIQKWRIYDASYDDLVGLVERTHRDIPEAEIVVMLHWNFDFEDLPFPAHRRLGRTLIDNGVKIVVGMHSHVVNGCEFYKDGLIVYGLGNFFIADGVYFDGKCFHPERSHVSMVLKIEDDIQKSKCIWVGHENEKESKMCIISEEYLADGEGVLRYSPYRGMDAEAYDKYFKKNRTKKKFVAIFYDYHNNWINKRKEQYTVFRMKLFRKVLDILKAR